MTNQNATKEFAEDKINQAQERLALRSSSLATQMNMYDLDEAIDALKEAVESLEEIKEAKESED